LQKDPRRGGGRRALEISVGSVFLKTEPRRVREEGEKESKKAGQITVSRDEVIDFEKAVATQ